MKALVIGFGSIGSRHARILKEMGHHVAVVSDHGTPEYPCHANVKTALQEEHPDYVIIANRTHHHNETLIDIIQYNAEKVSL